MLHPTKTDPYGNPERIGTKLAIEPEQAKWVEWIFKRYAEGMSPLKILTELNILQVPAPGAAYRRQYKRKPTWSAAAPHGYLTRGTGLLNNLLYAGRYVWNRSRPEKILTLTVERMWYATKSVDRHTDAASSHH